MDATTSNFALQKRKSAEVGVPLTQLIHPIEDQEEARLKKQKKEGDVAQEDGQLGQLEEPASEDVGALNRFVQKASTTRPEEEGDISMLISKADEEVKIFDTNNPNWDDSLFPWKKMYSNPFQVMVKFAIELSKSRLAPLGQPDSTTDVTAGHVSGRHMTKLSPYANMFRSFHPEIKLPQNSFRAALMTMWCMNQIQLAQETERRRNPAFENYINVIWEPIRSQFKKSKDVQKLEWWHYADCRVEVTLACVEKLMERPESKNSLTAVHLKWLLGQGPKHKSSSATPNGLSGGSQIPFSPERGEVSIPFAQSPMSNSIGNAPNSPGSMSGSDSSQKLPRLSQMVFELEKEAAKSRHQCARLTKELEEANAKLEEANMKIKELSSIVNIPINISSVVIPVDAGLETAATPMETTAATL